MAYRDIGKLLGVTGERARQIARRAARKLEVGLAEAGIDVGIAFTDKTSATSMAHPRGL